MSNIPETWVTRAYTKFDEHVGPLYFPPEPGTLECGFLADERHANRRGVVHGGMLTTAFDVALGTAGRSISGEHHHATVQLNVQFISGMKLGEFAIIRCEIVGTTRSMIFLRGVMRVGDRVVASADGVWKTLRPRGTE